MDKLIQSLGVVLLLLLLLAISRILSETNSIYLLPDSWGKQFVHTEGFMNLSPADSTLDKPRDSYAILRDALPTTETEGKLTAETCYNADFASHSDKVGDLLQRTNNYKHKNPESCSSPRTEFVNSFYLLP